MKIFLDANVIVSVLNKEYPLFTYSSRILSLENNRKFSVYTSPVCLAIACYFSEKKSGSVLARQKMQLLVKNINITAMTTQTVLQALDNKKVHDFEDGMQYYAAAASKCHVIITQDTGDFYFSDIEVLKPQDFMEKYL